LKISTLLKSQFLLSAFFKGLTGVIMFLSVSFLIAFFGDKTYGVWVLILSMFQWSLFFDFGISNVLKTKIPEFVVKNETKNTNEYITTSYISTGILALLMFLALLIAVFSVNLSQFFNLPFEEEPVNYLILINGAFFCLNLVLSMNKSLFIGINKNHIAEQSATVSQFSFFLFLILSISLLTKKTAFVNYT
jgi:Na+-driven multidrug efflux pump